MATSEARVEAKRKNALRSNGPVAPEGKERSRRNSLKKHGLSGSGVVSAEFDEAEVQRRVRTLWAKMNPSTELGEALIDQIATCSVRMQRGIRHEFAATA